MVCKRLKDIKESSVWQHAFKTAFMNDIEIYITTIFCYLRGYIDDLTDHWEGKHIKILKDVLVCGRYRLLFDALHFCKFDEPLRQKIQTNFPRQNPGQQLCHFTFALMA